MYGDIVEIADFSTFCHKYQVQILWIDKKHPWALHKYPLELFQSFSEFHRCPPGLTGACFRGWFCQKSAFWATLTTPMNQNQSSNSNYQRFETPRPLPYHFQGLWNLQWSPGGVTGGHRGRFRGLFCRKSAFWATLTTPMNQNQSSNSIYQRFETPRPLP